MFLTPQEMFDLIVDLGGKLHVKNRQGLTPLTLAAKLGRKDVSDPINVFSYFNDSLDDIY